LIWVNAPPATILLADVEAAIVCTPLDPLPSATQDSSAPPPSDAAASFTRWVLPSRQVPLSPVRAGVDPAVRRHGGDLPGAGRPVERVELPTQVDPRAGDDDRLDGVVGGDRPAVVDRAAGEAERREPATGGAVERGDGAADTEPSAANRHRVRHAGQRVAERVHRAPVPPSSRARLSRWAPLIAPNAPPT
jgi:hypothetical protein